MKDNYYIYFYARHWDDEDLCRLEMRSFFGKDTSANLLKSTISIEPSRSVFIKGRLDILFEAENWPSFLEMASTFSAGDKTFKTVSLNNTLLNTTKKIERQERRRLEREIGLVIQGEPNLTKPDIIFGFVMVDEKWYFGIYKESKAVSLLHRNKPHSYSTALSTSLARTIANIAAPFPKDVTVIDPCCGIGTVLIEALSMDFNIVGSDINWLVVKYTRENVAHFGYTCEIETKAIAAVDQEYDVAIIDMPYNIFTSASPIVQQEILIEARRIAKKVVIATIDTMDDMVEKANLKIIDRCQAKKSTFVRQILVCE